MQWTLRAGRTLADGGTVSVFDGDYCGVRCTRTETRMPDRRMVTIRFAAPYQIEHQGLTTTDFMTMDELIGHIERYWVRCDEECIRKAKVNLEETVTYKEAAALGNTTYKTIQMGAHRGYYDHVGLGRITLASLNRHTLANAR